MKYSIIDTAQGEEHGLLAQHHRLTANGTKMVVNENELLRVDPDIERAAAVLGGEVLTQNETLNILKNE